jgi:hypothetical protein
MKSIIFWDMTPCSPLNCAQRFGGTYRLHLQGRRNMFSKQATLKMEAISSSETSGATQRTTRRHIPENDTLQTFRDFREANVLTKSVDSISDLWRPRGDCPGRSPLNPALASGFCQGQFRIPEVKLVTGYC